MRKLYLLLLIMIGVSQQTFAQDGTRVYEFLNISTSARQAALGGNAQTAWDADPNMSLWNPALMNHKMHGQLAMNYVSYIADVNFATFSGVYQLTDIDFLSLHGQYVDYGKLIGADEIGNITGDFKANDAAIVLGYGREISDFFSVGVNLKYINSRIESYTSSAVAADIGISYHNFDDNFNATLVARNIGSQIKSYDGKKEKMPVQINLGLTHRLEHVPIELNLTLHDLQKFDNSIPENKNGKKTSFGRKFIDHVSIGAEIFPEQDFNLRIGYNFKRGNELAIDDVRSFSGLTYGFGFRANAFRIEYAHANYHKSGGANHFGIIVNLDRLIQGRDYWRSNPWL
ncbi:type IX secretion system protein PorQ [uncultured Weeksella sp.]|uniref:type IX secretion system protein PorQ n=1 Tax=uncultured Weeksella sp. TaxID=1161389 RepID=UPI00259BB887|nr:type IX secretion system protein PorQ [uncultured Weeksella sp.]